MVESAYYPQQKAHKSLFGRHSKDAGFANWKAPPISSYPSQSLAATPVQPSVIQPSLLGQQQAFFPQQQQAPLTFVPGGATASTVLPQQQLGSTFGSNTLPLTQTESHVYDRQVINQPVVHQVVHHPINEIHQQHIRKDIYAPPTTQIVQEQRLIPGSNMMLPSSGASGFGAMPSAQFGMAGGMGAGGYGQKEGFLQKMKRRRMEKKMRESGGMGGMGMGGMGYGTQSSGFAPSTVLPQVQQPVASNLQAPYINTPGFIQQQQGFIGQQQPGLTSGTWVSGRPRI